MKRLGAALFVAFALAGNAQAVLPSEQLSDPRLEARARHISQELRCVVCQNQTIDDSDAPLAHDLRVLLRERLKKGDSDDEAEAFIVKRYGTYVLLKPPFRLDTLVLWLGPFAALFAGALGAALYFRARSADALRSAGLSASDEAELKRIMER